MAKEQIDPNIIIDIASDLISYKEPTTRVGRWLRWVKRNNLGVKIKKPYRN
jgi:hypothetical protein